MAEEAEKKTAKAPSKSAAAAKPAAKAPAKSTAAKPAAKATAKPAAKAADKAEPKSAAKTTAKSTGSSAAAKSEEKPAVKSTAKSAAKPQAKKAKPEQEARPQVLKMHHLRPAPGSRTAKTRVGRGEGSKGKTAGRGTKGTKARYQVRAGLEGGNLNSVMRTPKLRGFKNPFRVEYQVVNLERLAELYPKGGEVTVSDLVAKGAVRKNEKVKVLGTGEIDVKLNVAVDKVSGSAEQKILAAGGSVK